MWDYFYNPAFWKCGWELLCLGLYSWLLPLIAGLLTRHFRQSDHRHIIAFVGFSLLMEHLSSDSDLIFLLDKETNSPWYHLLTPVLYLLMTRFFTRYLFVGRYRWVQWGLPLGFLLIAVINAIWGNGFYSFPTTTVGLYSVTGMVLAISYFIYLLRTLEVVYLERLPMFWISAGLLIYFAGSFLLWIGLNYINYDFSFFYSIYQINSVVTIVLNLFFTVAICLNPARASVDPVKMST
jgi:hypothetical protein